MTPRRQLLLGAFFIVALSILGYYTLFLTDFRPFGQTYEIVVHFPDASGLRPGDSVHVAGLRRGRIQTLVYDPSASLDRRISATLRLDEALELRQGFRIVIEEATLLGGHLVKIDPGPPQAPPIDLRGPLTGQVGSGALARIGELVDENRADLSAIVSDLRDASENMRAGKGVLGRLLFDEELAQDVRSGVADAKLVLADAAELTKGLREGKGVAGRLFNDEELWTQVRQIADRVETISGNVAAFSEDLRKGEGVLPRLISDTEWNDKARGILDDLASVAKKLDSTEGTVGQLIADDGIAKNVRSMVEKLDSLATKLEAGEGTLGKLLNDPAVYDQVRVVVDDLAAVTGALRRAEGSLGKLAMDDELYQEVLRAVGVVTRSLEEFREAAPITTFTSVLFGAF